jgi:hypothetical protein
MLALLDRFLDPNVTSTWATFEAARALAATQGLILVPRTPIYEKNDPRFCVQINGVTYAGKAYTIDYNAHGATDVATITLPIRKNDPDWSVLLAAFNQDTPAYVNIYAARSLPTYNPKQPSIGGMNIRFAGVIDQYDIELQVGTDEITFKCRSLAAPLIATKLTTPFASASTTTVQFIQEQAARFGLGTKINVASTPYTMQDVLASEYVTGVRNWVVWDLMLRCAMHDDVDIWVDKYGVLHYEAASLLDPSRAIIDCTWGKNVSSLKLTHTLQFTKNIQVEVHSYTKRTRFSSTSRASSSGDGGVSISTSSRFTSGQPVFGTNSYITTTYHPDGSTSVTSSSVSGGPSNSGTSGPISESGKEIYPFYVYNKTTQQCDDLAAKFYRQITMHEYAIDITIPVTADNWNTMDITAFLNLSAVPYQKFNSKFWPRKITESMSAKQKFEWSVTALNHTLPLGAV